MLRIVVIEDEYTIRNGLCQLIPKLKDSFQVIGNAENGYDGMQLIKRLNPDVAVCDIRMKRTDGLDMIKQLREANTECKFILLSGYSEFSYAQTAISLGVFGYLLKPVIPDELLEILTKAERKLELKTVEIESQQEYSHLISAAVDKIRKNFSSDISLSSMAQELGVTPEYLSARFTKEIGESFIIYLRNYRIKKACDLLLHTSKKMYEIAFLVGYDNPQYFSNVFKSVMGISPKSYMRNKKEKEE